MVELRKEEFFELGTGNVDVKNKVYVPVKVLEFLDLKSGDEVKYHIALDKEYRDMVIMKKSEA